MNPGVKWDQALPAPAKINLFLHVIGRRADGYHLLQTALRLLDFGDTLRFAPREDGQVRRSTPLVGVADEDDLCIRAARLLQQEACLRRGVSIALDKRLPLGGGLGGGSSDAATTLLALNRLWEVGMSRSELQALGLRLGADVPFFLFGESAFGEGIGEHLRPLRLAPAWYVVVEPGVSVRTQDIFADPRLTRNTEPIKITDFSASCERLDGAGEALRNDLEPVVCHRDPEVAAARGWLARFGPARMSGSGACVFATFSGAQEAQRVARQVPSRWRAWAARGLDEHPLKGLADC